MKIFVGYGYNEDDKWIEEMVFPLIESYGFKVDTGKELFGKNVPKSVLERINNSDAVIAFLTKRNAMKSSNTFSTHRWCIEELVATIPTNIPAVEIRDKAVESQDGMVFDRQRIEFDIKRKDKLLVELAKLVGGWQKQMMSKIVVLFDKKGPAYNTFSSRIHEWRCMYYFSVDGEKTPVFESIPYKAPDGSIVAKIKNIPDSLQSLIYITLENKVDKSSLALETLIHYQLIKR
ncbi:hypothetical protein [Spirosoma sp.]|uniref:hypothetical protein n=1 Tax=Spirosoma sp. TaxID=1899569 RepID=UPI0026035083|nr:hypothetical protein [Spirosoma sp.]MCX6217874.1 hypothetical protein [Spirosoma sp.]